MRYLGIVKYQLCYLLLLLLACGTWSSASAGEQRNFEVVVRTSFKGWLGENFRREIISTLEKEIRHDVNEMVKCFHDFPDSKNTSEKSSYRLTVSCRGRFLVGPLEKGYVNMKDLSTGVLFLKYVWYRPWSVTWKPFRFKLERCNGQKHEKVDSWVTTMPNLEDVVRVEGARRLGATHIVFPPEIITSPDLFWKRCKIPNRLCNFACQSVLNHWFPMRLVSRVRIIGMMEPRSLRFVPQPMYAAVLRVENRSPWVVNNVRFEVWGRDEYGAPAYLDPDPRRGKPDGYLPDRTHATAYGRTLQDTPRPDSTLYVETLKPGAIMDRDIVFAVCELPSRRDHPPRRAFSFEAKRLFKVPNELLEQLRKRILSDQGCRSAASLLSELHEDGLRVLKEALFSNSPKATKEVAAHGLGLMRGRMREKALVVLKKGLRSPDPDVREACQKRLCHLLEDGLRMLDEALFSDSPRATKDVAARGLASISGSMKEKALELLKKGLRSPDPDVREACKNALSAIAPSAPGE